MDRTKTSFMAFAVTTRQDYVAMYNKDPTYKELTEFAGPFWQQMSREEQDQYRSDRKRSKKRPMPEDIDKTPNKETFKLTQRNTDGRRVNRDIIQPTEHLPFAQKRQLLGSKKFTLLFITPRYAAGLNNTAPLEIACIVFSLEGGIHDADSWFILADIPDEQMADAEKRAATVHKVGVRPSPEAIKYSFPSSEVAEHLVEMTRDVEGPYWFVMGSYDNDRIAQGTMNWMQDDLCAEGEAEHNLFSPDRLLCVNSLVEELHKALSNHPHDSTRFPEWKEIVDHTKAQIGELKDICCPYHNTHPPTKYIGCALASARSIVTELFGLLLDVGGFERTEQHSITWTKPFQFPAAEEETDEEFWETLGRELEDLPITGEWEMFLRAEMEAKGIDPATVREYF